MGRRDSEGKRSEWMIESGDWEKLYAAFLKAKEKNNALDVRLERKLSALDGAKRHVDGVMFNDIFEQKQLVFKYKCEVRDLKRQALKKQNEFAKQRQTSRLRASNGLHQSKEFRSSNEALNPSRERTFVTQISQTQFPNLDKNGGKTTENIKMADHERAISQSARPAQSTQHFRFNTRGSNTSRRESVTNNTPKFPSVAHSNNNKMKRSSTEPNLTQQPEVNQNQEEEAKKLDIVVAEYWVGDPVAIRSVRRPRLNPNEMSDHSQTYGEARKLMVNMPKYPSCSRNCNRPGAELESMVTDVSTLPKIPMPNLNKELRRLNVSNDRLSRNLSSSHASLTVLDLLEQQKKSSSNEDKSQDTIIETVAKEQDTHAQRSTAQQKMNAVEMESPQQFRLTRNEAMIVEDMTDIETEHNQEKESPKLPRIYSKPSQKRVKVSDTSMSKETSNSMSFKSSGRNSRSSSVKSPSKLSIKSRPGLSGPGGATFGSSAPRPASLTVEEIIAANKNASLHAAAPIDVLARVQQGDIKVKSLTQTNRRINQMMEESEHRSITERTDMVTVDKKNRFKSHTVKEAIRYSPTKVAIRPPPTATVAS